MIRGIVFDKDGTLLDFEATWMPAFRRAAGVIAGGDGKRAARLLAAGGYDAVKKKIKSGSLFAAGNTALIAKSWLPHLADQTLEKLTVLIDDVFAEESGRHARALFDIAPLFARLKANGIAIGIASNDSIRGIETSLQALDILHLTDFRCGYDSGFGYKPEPGMVEAFCQSSGVPAAETAVVGDNPHDLKMGRRARAGLLVGVLNGNSCETELAPFADKLLASAEDIESILNVAVDRTNS